MVPTIARVADKRRDGPGVFSLDLVVDDGSWRGFLPGQFNMLSVFGVGEVPISLSGDPGNSRIAVHTVRAVGPVSSALVNLEAGEIVGLRGPYGVGWPIDAAVNEDVVVIAGGLGLPPVRPILYRLLAERQRYNRVTLLYGTRTPADILFLDEIAQWRQRLDIEVMVSVDRSDETWRGHVGVVTRLVPKADFDPTHTTAFVCGPEIMMRFGANALVTAGVKPNKIFLSLERNMKCAVGLCGHCQLGPVFVCKDGPVFDYERLKPLLAIKEL